MTKKRKPPDFICTPCAEKYGGTWPKDHVATWHISRCEYCQRRKRVCNIGDWDWPDGKRRGMRD